MRTISFSIDGKPRGKGRPRFGRGKVYTPQTTKQYERAVSVVAKSAMLGDEPTRGHVRVWIVAEFAIPKSWPKAKKELVSQGALHHTSKPDLDNIVKIILDGMNGVVFVDDSQVVSIMASKQYSGNGAAVYVDVSFVEG